MARCGAAAAAPVFLLFWAVSCELVNSRPLGCAAPGGASLLASRHRSDIDIAARTCDRHARLAASALVDADDGSRGKDLSLLQVVAGARRSTDAAKVAAPAATAVVATAEAAGSAAVAVGGAVAAAPPADAAVAEAAGDETAFMQQGVSVTPAAQRGGDGEASAATSDVAPWAAGPAEAGAEASAPRAAAANAVALAAAAAAQAAGAAGAASTAAAADTAGASAAQVKAQRAASAAGSAGSLEASASEGDVVQGLVFTMICLIIVLGIYLLVFNEYRPGEVAYPMHFDAAGGNLYQRPWQSRIGSTLQASNKFGSTKSLAAQETLRGTSFGMPGTPATLPGTQVTIAGNPPRSEDWYNELPMIYEQLVMPVANTRLAVPLAMLANPTFEVDVLGLSGVPLLSAVLASQGRGRCIEIALHSVGTAVARVTEDLEIFGADGRFVGVLKRDGTFPGMGDGPQLVLRDREGRPILLLVATRKDLGGRDFALRSVVDGMMKERATAVRKPPGKLPGEHYEVVAHPNVDAVLVLAVLLAAVVLESPVTGLSAPQPPSGRPSIVVPPYAGVSPAGGSCLTLGTGRQPLR